MLKKIGIVILILFCAAGSLRQAAASTYVDIEDSAVYDILDHLEADGVISDALLASKPLSRAEVLRLLHEAERNVQGRSAFLRDLVKELARRIGPADDKLKPVDSVYAGYIYTTAPVLTPVYVQTHEKEQAFNVNNDGDLYGRGSNYRVGITSRADDLGPFSIYLNPEFRSSDNTEKGVLNKGYAVFGFSWIDVIAGKDSQWWGPGYHGANLQSNNAEPLDMIKFTAPEPQTLPWIFKYLGPFQYSLFIARLDEARSDFSYPYLDGLHIDFKPLPWLEIGLERIELLGGSGRPLSSHQWIGSFVGLRRERDSTNAEAETDSQAGGYIKLTLPFAVQPVQLYWEKDGEDGRQRTFGIPFEYANLYGVYLPRLLDWERIGFRAEYADNHVGDHPYIWYTHGVYTSGMTYGDMVMGHHMGTNSTDLFYELSVRIPEARARLLLSYDRKTHDITGPVQEQIQEVMLKAELLLSEHLELTLSAGDGRIENPANLPDPALDVHEAAMEARYRF